jgi:hypothetical protein
MRRSAAPHRRKAGTHRRRSGENECVFTNHVVASSTANHLALLDEHGIAADQPSRWARRPLNATTNSKGLCMRRASNVEPWPALRAASAAMRRCPHKRAGG